MRKNLLLVIFLIIISIFLNSEDLKFSTYDKVTAKDYKKDKWDLHLKKAYNNIKDGNYSDAISNFNQAIDKGLKNQEVLKDLILCYIEINDLESAEQNIPKLGKSKYVTPLYEKIGNLYIENRNKDKAIEIFDKAGLYEKVAELYLDKKNEEKMVEYYEKAGKYDKIGEYFQKKNELKRAAIYYEKAGMYNIASELYLSIKEYEDAVRNLDKLNNFERIAKIYYDIGEYHKSFEYYKKMGKEKEGYKMLADVYFDKKEYKIALDYYKKCDLEDYGVQRIFNAYKNENREIEGYKILANNYYSYKGVEEANPFYENLKKELIEYESFEEIRKAREKNREYYFEKNTIAFLPDERLTIQQIVQIDKYNKDLILKEEFFLKMKISYIQRYGASATDIDNIEKFFYGLSKASIKSVMGYPSIIDKDGRWCYKYLFKYRNIYYDLWIEFDNNNIVKKVEPLLSNY